MGAVASCFPDAMLWKIVFVAEHAFSDLFALREKRKRWRDEGNIVNDSDEHVVASVW